MDIEAEKYDVFLSFTGVDTRKKFTSHLLAALERNGFQTFRDDTKLQRGEGIGPGLMKAIEDSRICLVVLSASYAMSKWCLDELAKIMDSNNKSQLIVLPIFYEIEPSDVRNQKGNVGEALAKHNVPSSRIDKWKAALTGIANLSGFVLQNMVDRDEASFIDLIIEEVERQLNPTMRLHVANHSVGIIPRLQKLHKLLALDSSDDVRIVAIWGIGGLGKTTIAKAAYNHICHQFDGSSFVAEVRQISQQPNGLFLLQKQILSDILRNGNCNIWNCHEGIEFIKTRAFYGRRILLVLDDVDHVQQLKAFAIDPKFLRGGSRIIITTRDISSLNSLRSVAEIYMPEQLNMHESLQLLSWHAFQKDHPMEEYMELSNEVVNYAGGVPLALEVLGSSLFGKTKSEWRSAMTKLKKIPHDDVVGKLRISFDSLNKEEKDLFLDIACFFVGISRKFTIQVLEGCNFFSEIGIRSLADRCLIKFELGSKFEYESRYMHSIIMHDILRDMGREIVRQESINEPSRRSRLWDHEDALEMLRNGEGTEAIEGLILLSPEIKDVKVKAKAFQNMKRLRVLHLQHVLLNGGYEHLSQRLVWLRWHGFRLKFVPSQLCLDNLVALDLSHSMIKHVWKGTKLLGKLKFIYLSHCYYLTTTPDFSGLSNLEELFLDNCIRLKEVDCSIRHLRKLLVINLANCKNLKKLPFESWMLNIEIFNISGCSKLEIFSTSHRAMSKSGYSLLSLWALRTKMVDSIALPINFVQNLSFLKQLRMANCNLSHIPTEIGRLAQLECLDLAGNNFSSLPNNFTNLTNLVDLNLSCCERLQSLPKLSTSLEILQVQNCLSLENVSLEANLNDCPEFAETYFVNLLARSLRVCVGSGIGSGIGSSIGSGVGSGVLTIAFSGDKFCNWLQYQSTESYQSYVVESLINQNLVGWIFCVVYSVKDYCGGLRPKIFNKTKGIQIEDKRECYMPTNILIGDEHFVDCTVLGYFAFLHQQHVEVQGGDEIEICLQSDNVAVKKWGLHPIYKAAHEMNIESTVQ